MAATTVVTVNTGTIDVAATLAPLIHGPRDPCAHRTPDGVIWRASLLPSGPVTYRIAPHTDASVTVHAWGPGRDDLIDRAPALVGATDTPESFDPVTDQVAQWAAQRPGVRVPRTGMVMESVVPAVLGQRVPGVDAVSAWRLLLQRFGAPAPLPDSLNVPLPRPLTVPPAADTWQRIPSWQWHLAGVDPARSAAIIRACQHAASLEAAAARSETDAVYRRLRSLQGIGEWTAAVVGARALGDADAIPWGDYHLGRVVGWALRGKIVDLDDVADIVAPWKPHRYRLWRLLELTPEAWPARRGPRITRQDHTWH